MKLSKNNDVVELTNPGHIDAFKQAGWVESKEKKKSEKAKENAGKK